MEFNDIPIEVQPGPIDFSTVAYFLSGDVWVEPWNGTESYMIQKHNGSIMSERGDIRGVESILKLEADYYRLPISDAQFLPSGFHYRKKNPTREELYQWIADHCAFMMLSGREGLKWCWEQIKNWMEAPGHRDIVKEEIEYFAKGGANPRCYSAKEIEIYKVVLLTIEKYGF